MMNKTTSDKLKEVNAICHDLCVHRGISPNINLISKIEALALALLADLRPAFVAGYDGNGTHVYKPNPTGTMILELERSEPSIADFLSSFRSDLENSKFSLPVQLFIENYDEMSTKEYRLKKPSYIHTEKVSMLTKSGVTVRNEFVSNYRLLLQNTQVKRGMIKRNSFPQRKFIESCEYFDNLFKDHDDIAMVSLYLYPDPTIAANGLPALLTQFLKRNRRDHPLYFMRGYIGNWVHSESKGLHAHITFFIDATKVPDDELLVTSIGQFWIDRINNKKGSYLSPVITLDQSPFEKNVIHINVKESKKINAIKERDILYLTKVEMYYQTTIDGIKNKLIKGELHSVQMKPKTQKKIQNLENSEITTKKILTPVETRSKRLTNKIKVIENINNPSETPIESLNVSELSFPTRWLPELLHDDAGKQTTSEIPIVILNTVHVPELPLQPTFDCPVTPQDPSKLDPNEDLKTLPSTTENYVRYFYKSLNVKPLPHKDSPSLTSIINSSKNSNQIHDENLKSPIDKETMDDGHRINELSDNASSTDIIVATATDKTETLVKQNQQLCCTSLSNNTFELTQADDNKPDPNAPEFIALTHDDLKSESVSEAIVEPIHSGVVDLIEPADYASIALSNQKANSRFAMMQRGVKRMAENKKLKIHVQEQAAPSSNFNKIDEAEVADRSEIKTISPTSSEIDELTETEPLCPENIQINRLSNETDSNITAPKEDEPFTPLTANIPIATIAPFIEVPHDLAIAYAVPKNEVSEVPTNSLPSNDDIEEDNLEKPAIKITEKPEAPNWWLDL